MFKLRTYCGLLPASGIFFLLITACGGSSSAERTPGLALSGQTDQINVTGTLQIENAEATVSNKKVEIQDAASNIIGSGITDGEGDFSVVIPGQLVIDSGSGLLGSDLTLLSSTVDDSTGKVFGIKQGLDLSGKSGSNLKLGNLNMKEVAAIRGQVSFIDQDGAENSKISKVGTEVYIPGLSIYGRTDNEGSFLLLYVPEGNHSLRIERGNFIKEVSVTVQANTTLDVGTVQVQTDTMAPSTTVNVDSTDFKNPLCLRLSADESASRIYFTIDGSTPTATDPFLYEEGSTSCGAQCPICLQGKTTTLKYFAVDKAGNAENQQTKLYVYNNRWADPDDTTAPVSTLNIGGTNVSGGSYVATGPVTVSLAVNEGADIYYTLDGTTPTTSSTPYGGTFNVTTSKTLKFFAKDYAGNQESIRTVTINVYNWSKITTTGSPPTNFNNLIYDAQRDQLVGVASDSGCVGSTISTWKLSGTTWSQIDSSSLGSCARAIGYQTTSHDYYLFLYGSGSSGSPIKAYKYNFTTNDWDHQADSANSAAGAERMIATWLVAESKFLIVYMPGAAGNSYYMTFDPGSSTFSSISTYASVPICDLAYDTARSRALAYGSCSAMGSVSGKVYEYASDTWTAVTTEQFGSGDTITFDSDRNRLITFGGGYFQSTALDETWEYDGTNWSQLRPASFPKRRTAATLSYDASRKRVLMFGGTDIFNQSLSDLWEYRY